MEPLHYLVMEGHSELPCVKPGYKRLINFFMDIKIPKDMMLTKHTDDGGKTCNGVHYNKDKSHNDS